MQREAKQQDRQFLFIRTMTRLKLKTKLVEQLDLLLKQIKPRKYLRVTVLSLITRENTCARRNSDFLNF